MAPISLPKLIVRDDAIALNNTTFYLLIILVVLLSIGVLAIGALILLKYIHRRKARTNEVDCVEKAQPRNHRRSRHPPSISISNEKAAFLERADLSGPPSPVPEIHITFPEEESHDNKRQSGRVVVVRISETGGVGLEPYQEQLPAYARDDTGRFQSLDLDRIGGLREKERS